MSKPYSSKALPAGTVIREWRIEDVLGVGGFGIVYKGRGIYFGELVAIKEYFPSAISERDAESTVVPIGSDVEEVHALGLKKFVEEAKLLWNLSTPTRHPNIVSVRALFEVHGTAYMIMDFEDGVSLSRLLKEGRRFNERSLWNVIKPVAEGLDRAHRVGVLHRDIKPPNILITDDNRPVLIDFGSARFEAAEATSTSVTFHTPPYAAVEQYVKTYPQGPWTDIYAMSVVLYECVTGEKPPEVLERMHGGLGTPLADGTWPGFSKRFLQAIDAGMTIKPSERPQSIREWLALFGRKDSEEVVAGDDEPTRFFAHEMASDGIAAVAPTAPGIDQKDLDTGVPMDPADVQFKRAGEETGASKKGKKKKEEEQPGAVAQAAAPAAPAVAEAPLSRKPEPEVEQKKPAPPAAKAKEPGDAWYRDPRKKMLAGGGALAIIAAAIAGTFVMGGGSKESGAPLEIPDLNGAESIPVEGLGQLIAAERTLASDAQTAGAPATAINSLVAASDQLDKQLAALQPLTGDPAQAGAAATRVDEMKRTATSANVAFVAALLSDADSKARSLPRNANSPAVTATLTDLRNSVQASSSLTDPVQSLGAARDALAKSQAFSAAITNAYSAVAANKAKAEKLEQAPKTETATTTTTTATPTAPVASTTTTTSSSAGASASKQAQLNSIVSSGRAMAKQVMKSGNKDNAALAKNYDKYLAEVANSARGARTDAEMDRLIKQANQTKAYLVFLQRQPSGQ